MKKFFISIALFVLAGAFSFLLKDIIDVRYPDQAVAKVTVTADSIELPVTVAGYQWQFLLNNKQIAKIPAPIVDLEPTPWPLLGGETIGLEFSQPAHRVTVKQSKSYSYDFFEIESEITVPFESGAYMYEVRAEFTKGWVLYYFYVVVS